MENKFDSITINDNGFFCNAEFTWPAHDMDDVLDALEGNVKITAPVLEKYLTEKGIIYFEGFFRYHETTDLFDAFCKAFRKAYYDWLDSL